MWKSTFWITFCSLVDITLAFVLQVILAARFGATEVMDAYLVATTIPTLFIGLLPGALNICLIPVFVEYATKGRREDAFAISNGVIVLFGLILSSIVLAGEFSAPWIISALAPGFDAARLAISSDLFRVLLPTLFLYGIANILGSVYYAQRKPFWPALSPVLRVAGMLVGVAVGRSWGIKALAWGDVLGTGLSLAVLGLDYLKSGGPRHWQGLWTPGTRRVTALLVPWLAGFAVSKANPLVERFLASGLSVGSITHLGYANQILNLIVIVMTKGFALSLFPVLSEKVTGRDFDSLREIIGRGIRGLLMMIVPVMALIALYGQLGIQVVFERGAFDSGSTRGTFLALLGYLGALLALPMGTVVTNTLYAFQDTRTVARVAVAGFAVNVIADLLLVQQAGVAGLAIGFSIVSLTNLLALYLILMRRIGKIHWWNRDLLLVLFATSIASGVSLLIQCQCDLVQLGKWPRMGMSIAVFGLLYLITGFALNIAEFRMIVTKISIGSSRWYQIIKRSKVREEISES